MTHRWVPTLRVVHGQYGGSIAAAPHTTISGRGAAIPPSQYSGSMAAALHTLFIPLFKQALNLPQQECVSTRFRRDNRSLQTCVIICIANRHTHNRSGEVIERGTTPPGGSQRLRRNRRPPQPPLAKVPLNGYGILRPTPQMCHNCNLTPSCPGT